MPVKKSSGWLTACLACFILLTGCSRYQYVMLGSRLPMNEKQEYVLENDSVRITYSCSGQNFPLSINVYNKLNYPVYIDLQRTTVIINDVQANPVDLFGGGSDFIAPQATAMITSAPLSDTLFGLKKNGNPVSKPRMTNAGKIYSFSEETSPLYMRVILAVSPNEDYSYPTFFDYSFWVSDIIENNTGPKNMNYKPSNQFYVKKTTGLGKTLSWTGAAAILVVGAMLGLTPEDGDY